MAIDDITAQKQAAICLSESENLLNSIFRAAPTGIGVTRNRTLTMVNDRICEMVGRDREELIGKSTRIFMQARPNMNMWEPKNIARLPSMGRDPSKPSGFARMDAK
jgi:PAS domain-containing protein